MCVSMCVCLYSCDALPPCSKGALSLPIRGRGYKGKGEWKDIRNCVCMNMGEGVHILAECC